MRLINVTYSTWVPQSWGATMYTISMYRLWHFWSGNVATKWCCSQTYPVNKVYKMTGNRPCSKITSINQFQVNKVATKPSSIRLHSVYKTGLLGKMVDCKQR